MANENAMIFMAQQLGARAWRNNVGVLKDTRGVPVRYGLANTSPQMNRMLKSSDLIGCHQGGRFLSWEVKPHGWKLRPSDDRGAAQLAWLELIAGLGGDARFTTPEGYYLPSMPDVLIPWDR